MWMELSATRLQRSYTRLEREKKNRLLNWIIRMLRAKAIFLMYWLCKKTSALEYCIDWNPRPNFEMTFSIYKPVRGRPKTTSTSKIERPNPPPPPPSVTRPEWSHTLGFEPRPPILRHQLFSPSPLANVIFGWPPYEMSFVCLILKWFLGKKFFFLFSKMVYADWSAQLWLVIFCMCVMALSTNASESLQY